MTNTTKRAADAITGDIMAALDAAIANAKPAEPQPTTWEDFLPLVEQAMAARDLDNALPYFARMVAKIKADELPENGAIFSGCTGSGKTIRARLLANFCGIRMKTARNMALELANKAITLGNIRDAAALDCVETKSRNRPYDLIIDDLGAEPPDFTIYGTRLDLMGLMLEERLEKAGSVKTYITTNLDAQGIRKRYGERVFSRMQEHFIFLRMPNTDRRTGKAYGWS